MKPMVYGDHKSKPEILHQEERDNFRIMILSFGTHPCAYIGVPNDSPLVNLDYGLLDNFINVHGGFTFGCQGSDERYPFIAGYYWYGWDYAHLDDWLGCHFEDEWIKDLWQAIRPKKWTTEEIYEHCLVALEQFKQLEKRMLHDVEFYDSLIQCNLNSEDPLRFSHYIPSAPDR